MTKNQQRQLYWSLSAVWTIFIYATLGIVRPICEFLRQWGALNFLVSGAIIVTIIAAVWLALLRRPPRQKRVYLFLILILAAYAGLMVYLRIPEERVHLLQYGMLAFLIYRAAKLDVADIRAYGVSLSLTSLLGWIDECLQHITPGRFFDWKDVLLNAVSAALALALIFVLQNRSPQNR